MACKIRAYYLLAVVLCSVLLNLSRVQAQDQDYSYRENHLLVAGDSLIDFENWDGALNAFFAAESVFDQLEHTPASIHTKGKIAYCYMQQKAYKTAFVYLSKAMAEGDKLPEKDISEICTIYSHLGEYYLKKSQPSLDSSLLAHKRAIEICEKGLPEVNEDLAQAYWGMGWYYYKRDQFLESINYYRKSFEIQEQVLGPDNQQLGITSQWLGISYRNLGDPFRAQDYLKRAIEIFESNYAFSPSHDYVAYTSLANTHFDIKEFEIAQPLYEKALSIGSMSASPQTRISPLNNLASTYAHTNRPDSANVLFHEALNISLNSEKIVDYNLWTTYLQMGDYFLRYNNLDSARYCFEKSVEIVENMANPTPNAVASSYAWLARVEAKSGNINNSLTLIQRAIIALEFNFEDEDIYSNPILSKTLIDHFLYEYLEVKADIFFLRFLQTQDVVDLEESLKLYLLVDEMADVIRNGSYSDRTKLLVAKSFKHTASSAIRNIQLLYDQSRDDKYVSIAFDFMEKNRYAELYANISKLKTVSGSDILQDSLYNLEQENIYEISELRYELSNDPVDSIKAEIERELFELEKEYEVLRESIAIQFPSYQKVNYDSLISISEVQEQLEENTQLIEFFWGDSLFQTLSIGMEETRLSTFKITKEFKEKVLLLQKLISNPDLNRNQQELFDEYSIVSHEIYQALLGELIDEKIKKIIISPDGPLSLIPFEALIVSLNGSSFRNADYLLRNTDIQYVYSTNLWLKNLAKEAIENPKILAFAYSNGNEINTESRRSLNEIPASAEEVTTIKNIFKENADILYGEKATETAFKELAVNYNILHLAVHGIGDTLNSNNSRLIFKIASDSIDDGDLYAHELYTIPFSELRLAVLSACETGIGKEYPGEGIFSMARGFTYTGCPTTIMSLWKVSDALTARIMGLFYEYLNKGLSTSQSLRMAKLEYLSESKSINAHPSYWAALVQLGDSKPAIKPKNFIEKYGLWFLPAMLILIVYRTRRSRK